MRLSEIATWGRLALVMIEVKLSDHRPNLSTALIICSSLGLMTPIMEAVIGGRSLNLELPIVLASRLLASVALGRSCCLSVIMRGAIIKGFKSLYATFWTLKMLHERDKY